MATSLRLCAKVALLCGLPVAAALAAPGAFSLAGLAGWEAQTFKGKTPTSYELEQDGGVQVLQARCHDSASGYLWREKIDLRQTPVLSWRWRVHTLFKGIREREKSGDDFIARVYVVRDGGWALWRTRSLVYVWSNGGAGAADWPSAYAAQAHVVALRAGADGLGQWREERRDVRADFKTYLGLDVDAIDAVALMTDCDDSHVSGRADYGDIRFGGR